MSDVYSVAVFCGSRSGADPRFAAAARALGLGLAGRGIRLVYGAGSNGLMGVLANAALESGGRVLGVIPDFLVRWEVAHPGLTERIVTQTMHERKRVMAEQADAFVMMPGGIGTLDETIEILSWRQLRLHDKPIFLCDVAGSAAPVLAAIEGSIALGFAAPDTRALFSVVDGVAALLEALDRAPSGMGLTGERV